MYFFHKSQYEAKFGSVIRMITDMSDNSFVYGSWDTGVEQRATRSNRDDFIDKFNRGELIKMPTSLKTDKLNIREPLLKVRKT